MLSLNTENIVFNPVWFDSLGAKSSCTFVRTPDVSILIDPGVAVMQPSFPASPLKKRFWAEQARWAIKKAGRKSQIIVISHYHHDHYVDFDEELYKGKIILAKNPNDYINDTQRSRACRFYENICKNFGKTNLEDFLKERKAKEYSDPLEELPLARKRDYGDYRERKLELLEKGKRWFMKRVENWNSWKLIPEFKFEECKVRFADNREFRFGNTCVRFSKPFFHGIEYARVGWVISTIITFKNEKFIHTSDLEGPVIEDQAEWIIRENPNILVLDGPSTYLIPYMLNLINLRRAVENMCRILRETDVDLVIYDHHLPRDVRFKKWVRDVYETAEREGKRVLTAAEYLGKTPAVLRNVSGK